MTQFLIVGVGGQGTVLASKILAAAALAQGMQVRTTETIGMAQRGGTVMSHVKMGECVASPMIAAHQADVILAFEPSEAVRALPFLKPDGMLIVCTDPIAPITSSLHGGYDVAPQLDYLQAHVARLKLVDGAGLLTCCGNKKALNIALLGCAAACGVLPFGADDLLQVMLQNIPERFAEMNRRAYEFGRKQA